MADNTPVLLRLPGATSCLTVEVLPRGLTVHRLIVQVDGRTHDIVIGPEKPEDHVTQKYTNTVIGRYSNRIPVGKHVLERNNIRSEFEAQANENPQVSLHGGPTGFDSVMWTVLSKGETPKLFSEVEFSRIQILSGEEEEGEEGYAIFRLISPDGDQGYPGELTTEALVALVPPAPDTAYNGAAAGKLGHVVIVYRSKLSHPERMVTPVNLTQHWGFNLDASLQDGLEGLSVKNHELTIKADSIIERDELSLATGSFIPISQAPAHLHDNKPVGDKFPESGYDDYYRFISSVVYPFPTRIPLSSLESGDLNLLDDILTPGDISSTPSPVQLSSGKSGLALKFHTNQHGVMFYSNNLSTPAKGARKLVHGGSGISGRGDSYGPGTAAFLEFHDPLTAFLDPKNRDAEDTLLTSDEVYNNFVRLEIGFRKP